MDDRSDVIAQFCGITDAPAHVAENYLEAMEWQLDRAVDFYLEHPPNHDPGPEGPPPAQPEAIEIPDDDEAEGAGIPQLAQQRASALAARRRAEQQADDDAAAGGLAVHGRGLGPGSAAALGMFPAPAAPAPGFPGDDDEDLLAAAAAAGAGSAAEGGVSSLHRRQQEQLLAHYQAAARQQAAAAARPPAAAGEAFVGDDDDNQAAAAAAAADAADAAAAAGLGVGAAGGGAGDMSVDLPEGINIEEARMLEAAMLGIPYQGRIPDFSNPRLPAAPLSPGSLEQRNLREEQDAAYEESLALDRAKQASIAAAEAEARAEACRQQEEAAAAERAAAAAQQQLAALLDTKRQRLPPEPGAGEGGVLQIVVRLPDGSRRGRRFRAGDPLQAVFDFVDLEAGGGGGGAEQQGDGGSGIQPGSYRLVMQFPRRVFVEGSGSSLADAGIAADSALFVESSSA